MTWVAAAVIGGSVISGAMGASASRDAASRQSDAADRASELQAQANRESLALQKEMFDKQVSLQEPFRQNGLTAQNQLMALMGGKMGRGFTAEDFQQDQGYQFRMQQGMDGVQNSAAARGGLLSGATLKALQKYGQDFASNEYQNAYNRFNTDNTNVFNRYASIAGQGQTASNAIGSAAAGYGSGASNTMMNGANAIGSNIMGAGNAQAAGLVGGANAWGNALSSGINGWQQNELMKRIGGTPSYSYIPTNANTTIPMQPGGGY